MPSDPTLTPQQQAERDSLPASVRKVYEVDARFNGHDTAYRSAVRALEKASLPAPPAATATPPRKPPSKALSDLANATATASGDDLATGALDAIDAIGAPPQPGLTGRIYASDAFIRAASPKTVDTANDQRALTRRLTDPQSGLAKDLDPASRTMLGYTEAFGRYAGRQIQGVADAAAGFKKATEESYGVDLTPSLDTALQVAVPLYGAMRLGERLPGYIASSVAEVAKPAGEALSAAAQGDTDKALSAAGETAGVMLDRTTKQSVLPVGLNAVSAGLAATPNVTVPNPYALVDEDVAPLIEIEGPAKYGLRLMNTVGAGFGEAAGRASDAAGFTTREGRGRDRTSASEFAGSQFLIDALQGVENNEGVTEVAQAIAKQNGLQGTWQGRLLEQVGMGVDVLLPGEKIMGAPLAARNTLATARELGAETGVGFTQALGATVAESLPAWLSRGSIVDVGAAAESRVRNLLDQGNGVEALGPIGTNIIAELVTEGLDSTKINEGLRNPATAAEMKDRVAGAARIVGAAEARRMFGDSRGIAYQSPTAGRQVFLTEKEFQRINADFKRDFDGSMNEASRPEGAEIRRKVAESLGLDPAEAARVAMDPASWKDALLPALLDRAASPGRVARQRVGPALLPPIARMRDRVIAREMLGRRNESLLKGIIDGVERTITWPLRYAPELHREARDAKKVAENAMETSAERANKNLRFVSKEVAAGRMTKDQALVELGLDGVTPTPEILAALRGKGLDAAAEMGAKAGVSGVVAGVRAARDAAIEEAQSIRDTETARIKEEKNKEIDRVGTVAEADLERAKEEAKREIARVEAEAEAELKRLSEEKKLTEEEKRSSEDEIRAELDAKKEDIDARYAPRRADLVSKLAEHERLLGKIEDARESLRRDEEDLARTLRAEGLTAEQVATELSGLDSEGRPVAPDVEGRKTWQAPSVVPGIVATAVPGAEVFAKDANGGWIARVGNEWFAVDARGKKTSLGEVGNLQFISDWDGRKPVKATKKNPNPKQPDVLIENEPFAGAQPFRRGANRLNKVGAPINEVHAATLTDAPRIPVDNQKFLDNMRIALGHLQATPLERARIDSLIERTRARRRQGQFSPELTPDDAALAEPGATTGRVRDQKPLPETAEAALPGALGLIASVAARMYDLRAGALAEWVQRRISGTLNAQFSILDNADKEGGGPAAPANSVWSVPDFRERVRRAQPGSTLDYVWSSTTRKSGQRVMVNVDAAQRVLAAGDAAAKIVREQLGLDGPRNKPIPTPTRDFEVSSLVDQALDTVAGEDPVLRAKAAFVLLDRMADVRRDRLGNVEKFLVDRGLAFRAVEEAADGTVNVGDLKPDGIMSALQREILKTPVEGAAQLASLRQRADRLRSKIAEQREVLAGLEEVESDIKADQFKAELEAVRKKVRAEKAEAEKEKKARIKALRAEIAARTGEKDSTVRAERDATTDRLRTERDATLERLRTERDATQERLRAERDATEARLSEEAKQITGTRATKDSPGEKGPLRESTAALIEELQKLEDPHPDVVLKKIDEWMDANTVVQEVAELADAKAALLITREALKKGLDEAVRAGIVTEARAQAAMATGSTTAMTQALVDGLNDQKRKALDFAKLVVESVATSPARGALDLDTALDLAEAWSDAVAGNPNRLHELVRASIGPDAKNKPGIAHGKLFDIDEAGARMVTFIERDRQLKRSLQRMVAAGMGIKVSEVAAIGRKAGLDPVSFVAEVLQRVGRGDAQLDVRSGRLVPASPYGMSLAQQVALDIAERSGLGSPFMSKGLEAVRPDALYGRGLEAIRQEAPTRSTENPGGVPEWQVEDAKRLLEEGDAVLVAAVHMSDLRNAAARGVIPDWLPDEMRSKWPTVGRLLGRWLSASKMAWVMGVMGSRVPHFIVSNILSFPTQKFLKSGMRGSIRTVANIASHPREFASFVRTLVQGTESGVIVKDRLGRDHSLDAMAKAAHEAGLDSASVRTELAQDLLDSGRTYFSELFPGSKDAAAMRDIRGLLGMGWAAVQGLSDLHRFWWTIIHNAVHAVDMSARATEFFDQVLDGQSYETAAREARDVYYDYSDMTQFERFWLTKLFPFYAFWRQNVRAHLRSIWQDPSRVARLARAQVRQWDKDEYEKMNDRDVWARRIPFITSLLATDPRDARYASVMPVGSPSDLGAFLELVMATYRIAGGAAGLRPGRIAGEEYGFGAMKKGLEYGIDQTISPVRETYQAFWGDREWKKGQGRVPETLVKMGKEGEWLTSFIWTDENGEPIKMNDLLDIQAEQTDDPAIPGGVLYYVRPNTASASLWLALRAAGVVDPFLGPANVKGGEYVTGAARVGPIATGARDLYVPSDVQASWSAEKAFDSLTSDLAADARKASPLPR